MSMDFLLVDGDLDFRSEFADTTEDDALVVQHLETALQIGTGEYPTDIRDGFPWLSHALTRQFYVAGFRGDLEDTMDLVPEIVTTEVTVTQAARKVTAVLKGAINRRRFIGQLTTSSPSDDTVQGNGVFASFVPILMSR